MRLHPIAFTAALNEESPTLGRNEPAAEFQTAADELGAEFEAAFVRHGHGRIDAAPLLRLADCPDSSA